MERDASRLRELFEDLARGRSRALEEVYELMSAEIYGLALWRCGRRSDAEDVVQDVFLRLAERHERLGTVRDPRAYVLGIAHRAAIDVHRRRQRQAETALEDCPLLESSPGSPEERVDAMRLSRLLAELPDSQSAPGAANTENPS